MILIYLFHTIFANEQAKTNINPVQKALIMKMSQYIEENFMKSEDAFLTAEPDIDEDVCDEFIWDGFKIAKMEKIFEKLNKLMKAPFRQNIWTINTMNI
jgi:hypothetical protein